MAKVSTGDNELNWQSWGKYVETDLVTCRRCDYRKQGCGMKRRLGAEFYLNNALTSNAIQSKQPSHILELVRTYKAIYNKSENLWPIGIWKEAPDEESIDEVVKSWLIKTWPATKSYVACKENRVVGHVSLIDLLAPEERQAAILLRARRDSGRNERLPSVVNALEWKEIVLLEQLKVTEAYEEALSHAFWHFSDDEQWDYPGLIERIKQKLYEYIRKSPGP